MVASYYQYQQEPEESSFTPSLCCRVVGARDGRSVKEGGRRKRERERKEGGLRVRATRSLSAAP